MKKTIITMLIALVAMFASAETYNYLKFTKTNGSTVTYDQRFDRDLFGRRPQAHLR